MCYVTQSSRLPCLEEQLGPRPIEDKALVLCSYPIPCGGVPAVVTPVLGRTGDSGPSVAQSRESRAWLPTRSYGSNLFPPLPQHQTERPNLSASTGEALGMLGQTHLLARGGGQVTFMAVNWARRECRVIK